VSGILAIVKHPAKPEVLSPRGAIKHRALPRAVWIAGPLGGHVTITDPEALEAEARRLMEAAEWLREAS
jgi:hypothetical protein